MINYSIFVKSSKPGTKKADIQETKAYGNSQVSEVFDINQFAKHITDHGSVYDRADVAAVLTKAVDCLRELLLEGKKIRLGDMGDFYPSLKTKGATLAEDFNATNILAVNVRWKPGKNFKNLRNDAVFQLVPTRSGQAEANKTIKNQETIQGME